MNKSYFAEEIRKNKLCVSLISSAKPREMIFIESSWACTPATDYPD
jgi:hypothetical protein